MMLVWLSGFLTSFFFWNLEDENYGRAFWDMIVAIICLYIEGNR